MKNVKLQLAVFGAFGLISTHTQAGVVNLPIAGFPASGGDPASAYTRCYAAGRVIPPLSGPATAALLARGNFGNLAPAGSSGVCEITGLVNDAIAPLPGYGAAITATTQNIVTGGTTVGQVTERVWRKLAATSPATATNMCIIGTKFVSHSSSGLGINDIVRGGYAGLVVDAGYRTSSGGGNYNDYVVSRIGRTYTSVQHRAYIYGGGTLAEKQNNGINYLDIPSIGGSATLSINGINAPLAPNAVAPAAGSGQQDAQLNENWVNFTIDNAPTSVDAFNLISPMTYIQFDCGSNTDNAATINASWRKEGALRLRKTAQKNTTFSEISMTGYAPPGATVP